MHIVGGSYICDIVVSVAADTSINLRIISLGGMSLCDPRVWGLTDIEQGI